MPFASTLHTPRRSTAGLAWAAGVNYLPDEIVTYAGSSWIAIRANVGVAPVDGLDWEELAQAGADASSILVGPVDIAANATTTSTSYADVTGLALPQIGTTSPVQLVAAGIIGLIGTNIAANTSITGSGLQILDESDNVRGAYGATLLMPTFNPGTQTWTQVVYWVVGITPDASTRVYRIQYKAHTGTSFRLYTSTVVGNRFRFYARTPG